MTPSLVPVVLTGEPPPLTSPISPDERIEIDLASGYRVWLAGALIAFLYTIPLLNLVVPVVATAFMLHLFEHLRAKDSAAAPLMLEPTGIEGVS